jgi:hypothetical protein
MSNAGLCRIGVVSLVITALITILFRIIRLKIPAQVLPSAGSWVENSDVESAEGTIDLRPPHWDGAPVRLARYSAKWNERVGKQKPTLDYLFNSVDGFVIFAQLQEGLRPNLEHLHLGVC